MYSGDNWDRFGWAVFIAGGYLPVLPSNINKNLLKAAAEMKPDSEAGNYVLAGEKGLIAYAGEGKTTLDLSKWKGQFKVKYINTENGNLLKSKKNIKAGGRVNLTLPDHSGVVWLTKKG